MSRSTPAATLSLLGIALSVPLSACGGSPPPEEEHGGDTLFTSAGGDDAENGTPEPISSGPAPLPVPTPPVARGSMSVALQNLWTETERVLAESPPEAPPNDDPNVDEWTSSTLSAWLRTRTGAVTSLTRSLGDLGEGPLYERAVGAALVAMVVEDMTADVRGVPMPMGISSDPELLGIYRESLDAALEPMAEQAASFYQACALALDRHGDASWGEWRAFCFERAEELEEVYGDAAPQADDGGDD